MRFLILTQYFVPEMGAAQLRLAAVARELLEQGHEVEVLTAMPNHPTGSIFPAYRRRFYCVEDWEGIRVHRVWLYAALGTGLRRVLNYLSFPATALGGLLRVSRPDVLFVESPSLFLSLPSYIASRLWQVPVIFNVSDLWPDSVKQLGVIGDGIIFRLAKWLEAFAYASSDFVSAVTEGIRATLINEKQVARERVLFLPNGVDTQLFRPGPPDAELVAKLGMVAKQVILYAGTIGIAHGVEVVLEAARLLCDAPVHFLIVGEGSEKVSLAVRATQYGLSNVTLLDAVPPTEVARLYDIAAAGLSTLRRNPLFEGTRPVKILASMASGKPVIYCGEGEGARLILEANAGVVVPPEDPKALACAIRSLLGDDDRRTRMGQEGRRFVVERLSWAKITRDWVTELNSKLEVSRGS